MTAPLLPGLFDAAVDLTPTPIVLEVPPVESCPSLDEAAIARRSGRKRAGEEGQRLRDRYRALLIAHGPLTDHAAGALLGVLSTTAGARRIEWMTELPGCIEACGRERVAFGAGRAVSRTTWRWTR